MFLGQVCEPGRDPRCGLTGPGGQAWRVLLGSPTAPEPSAPVAVPGGCVVPPGPALAEHVPRPWPSLITAARRGSWQREPQGTIPPPGRAVQSRGRLHVG